MCFPTVSTHAYPRHISDQHLRVLSNQFDVPAFRRLEPKLGEREKFLLFVKILLKYLERTGRTELRQQVKVIVAQCVLRNRLGDRDFFPLKETVEQKLRMLVSPILWYRVEAYCDIFSDQIMRAHVTFV